MMLKKIFLWVILVGIVLFMGFICFLIYHFKFVVTGPRQETPFEIAHQRAVSTFVAGKGFGIRRFREKEYFNEYSVLLEDGIWNVEKLHLIGVSAEYGERYFEGYWVPLKDKLGDSESRLLKPGETEAIAKLRGGEGFVFLKAEEVSRNSSSLRRRVVAPVVARESCLKCHETDVGDLLGAFDYYLYREKEEAED